MPTPNIEGIQVANSKEVGNDNPVVFGFLSMIFEVAGKIQPTQPEAFAAANRVTELIQNGATPDLLNMDDVSTVFRAAGCLFERYTAE